MSGAASDLLGFLAAVRAAFPRATSISVDFLGTGDVVAVNLATDEDAIAAANVLGVRVRKACFEGMTWLDARAQLGSTAITVSGPHAKITANDVIPWRPSDGMAVKP